MHYSGDVFRPPSEAYSLILQVTLGCSHNRCAFCYMYKAKKFSIRPLREVFEDIEEAAPYRFRRVFLADGDALILPTETLVQILTRIRKRIPTCQRVGVYGSPNSILRKTPEELETLRKLGLGIVYMGLESGNDAVLKKFDKGFDAASIIQAGQRVKQAGLLLSVTAINGLGGQEMSEAHALDTAKAFTAMKPDYVGMLTLRVYGNTPLAGWVQRGEFKLLDGPLALARENRLLIEHMDCEGTVFRSNHARNYLALAGTLNKDKDRLLAQLDAALEGKRRFRSEVQLGF